MNSAALALLVKDYSRPLREGDASALMPKLDAAGERVCKLQFSVSGGHYIRSRPFFKPRWGGLEDFSHTYESRLRDPVACAQIYDLVTKHFLACCSKDAVGHQTKASNLRKRESTPPIHVFFIRRYCCYVDAELSATR